MGRGMFGLVLVVAMTAACGGAPSKPVSAAQQAIELQIAGGKEQIIDASTGKPVTFEEMMTSLLTAKVIYIGERHDNADDHGVQYAILDGFGTRSTSLAVGLEMFQYPYQQPLDDWSAERIDEAKMLKRTQYEKRWGFDFDFYRPLLETARTLSARIVALNAPMEVTHAIAHGGLAALDPVQISELPELDLHNKRHRKLVEAEIAQHELMEPEAVDRFYAAQVVWDETMALHVASTMNAATAPEHMIVFAGRMHVLGGSGIPERAAKRGVKSWKSVIPIEASDPIAKWTGPAEDRPADYLWVIPGVADSAVSPPPPKPALTPR